MSQQHHFPGLCTQCCPHTPLWKLLELNHRFCLWRFAPYLPWTPDRDTTTLKATTNPADNEANDEEAYQIQRCQEEADNPEWEMDRVWYEQEKQHEKEQREAVARCKKTDCVGHKDENDQGDNEFLYLLKKDVSEQEWRQVQQQLFRTQRWRLRIWNKEALSAWKQFYKECF